MAKMGKIHANYNSENASAPGLAGYPTFDPSALSALVSANGLSPGLAAVNSLSNPFGPYAGYTPTAQEQANAHFDSGSQQWGPFTIQWLEDNQQYGIYIAQATWTNGPPAGYASEQPGGNPVPYTYVNGVGGENIQGIGFVPMSHKEYGSFGTSIGMMGLAGTCAISIGTGGWIGVLGCAFAIMAAHDDVGQAVQDWENSYTSSDYNREQQFSDGMYLSNMALAGHDFDADSGGGNVTASDSAQNSDWAGPGDSSASWDNNGWVTETEGQNDHTQDQIVYDGGGDKYTPHVVADLSQAIVKNVSAGVSVPRMQAIGGTTAGTVAASFYSATGADAASIPTLQRLTGSDWKPAFGSMTHVLDAVIHVTEIPAPAFLQPSGSAGYEHLLMFGFHTAHV